MRIFGLPAFLPLLLEQNDFERLEEYEQWIYASVGFKHLLTVCPTKIKLPILLSIQVEKFG